MNTLLAAELEELEQEKVQQFKIETPEQANWALRKFRALQAKADQAVKLADTEIERIKTWLEGETKSAQESMLFFYKLLEEYHQRELAKDPNTKTIKLPYGQLQMRAQQPEYKRDTDKLIPWVKKNRPEFLIPQPAKLDWAGLKKAITVAGDTTVDPETGEAIPGIQVEQREPKFTVKVDK